MMPDPVLTKSDQNLIWIDLEMTGLLPASDRIIEIAVVVTDPQLTVRVEGPVFAVHQSDAVLDGMDAWNKGTHGKSGLIDRVKASTVDEAAAEAAGDRLPGALRGQGQEPDVRQQHLPGPALPGQGHAALEAFFHYRNLDVSTLKELARRWKPAALDGFKKAQAHTALADIHESIDEPLPPAPAGGLNATRQSEAHRGLALQLQVLSFGTPGRGPKAAGRCMPTRCRLCWWRNRWKRRARSSRWCCRTWGPCHTLSHPLHTLGR
jgi:oligoribonuclease